MLIRQQLLTEELHSCSLRQLWLMINQYTEVINPDTNTHARTHTDIHVSGSKKYGCLERDDMTRD